MSLFTAIAAPILITASLFSIMQNQEDTSSSAGVHKEEASPHPQPLKAAKAAMPAVYSPLQSQQSFIYFLVKKASLEKMGNLPEQLLAKEAKDLATMLGTTKPLEVG